MPILLAATACERSDPNVCDVVMMTESEYTAYEAVPDDQKPEHCAIQVIPDELSQQVNFEIVDPA
ncbi:hypothetical protein [Cognatiyoonia sp. IB215182]|uniref:hypothetical protein n=1 Tax=Cognatiyoonia sp. IB215182 TaxID=3097353 RepID=UPI002A13AE29|nr:hypothetical protein [Cognatiyoonia sp. IB215182]MDX8354378.1 hypothetical protein [Cognatiyoonia sp. IB215182]